MQAKLGQLAICSAVASMAFVLNGCGEAKALPTCDDGFFKDKNGHEVVASATAVPGLDEPVVELLCKSEDAPKKDGYVRSYQTYHYKGNNPLSCQMAGASHSIPGGSAVTIRCPRNHKGWVVAATGEEAKGVTLSDECVKEQVRTYITCNLDGCHGECAVLKKGVEGIPMKDAPDGDCCTVDDDCPKKAEDQTDDTLPRTAERRYEATGWFFREAPSSARLFMSAVIMAGVVGLVTGARRVYGTQRLLSHVELQESIEDGEE